MSRVIVVGAGVVGLSCAVRLAEAGYDVAVMARDLPLETTSAVAAALWYPYRADPPERMLGWAATSYAEFERLARTVPEAGVRMRLGAEVSTTTIPDPWWASAVPGLERVTGLEPPYADGLRFKSPVADMSVYLPWLVRRLDELGGTLTRQALSALPDHAPLVVNCSGLGSRHLATDRTLRPIRGQICVLEQTGITQWRVGHSPGETTSCYVVPRLHDVVVGGTADEDVWDLGHDPDVATRMLTRAERLVPAIAGARVLAHRTGLRPGRPTVRLEAEDRGGTTIVHCYGHGGSGMTVSWGCADEVVTLASARGRP